MSEQFQMATWTKLNWTWFNQTGEVDFCPCDNLREKSSKEMIQLIWFRQQSINLWVDKQVINQKIDLQMISVPVFNIFSSNSATN